MSLIFQKKVLIKGLLKLLALLHFIPFISAAELRICTKPVQQTSYFTKTVKASCFNDQKEVGYLYYEKLPFSFYVIHTFFVRAPYRNKAIGSHLLKKTCHKIKECGGRLIIIQPGPFDLENGEFKAISNNRSHKLEQLVRLYHKAGFNRAPWLLRTIAGFLYKVVRLAEDADFLMIQ